MNLEGQYLTISIPYVVFIICSCLVFALSVVRKRTPKTYLRGTFLAYYIQVIYLTFFSTSIYIAFNQQAQLSLEANFGKHPFLFKNFVPFSSIADQLVWHYIDLSMILNIGLTIPFGIFLVLRCYLQKKPVRIRSIIWQGLMFTLVIEGMQMLGNYVLQYRHRIVTIDDIIMNVLGTVIGAVLMLVVIWVSQKTKQWKRRAT